MDSITYQGVHNGRNGIVYQRGGTPLGFFFLLLNHINPRDIRGEGQRLDGNIVVRPAVAPFQFKPWINGGNWVVKGPLLEWTDRGNDDHLLQKKYGREPWFKPYMDGLDDFRRGLIDKYTGEDLQNNTFKQFESSEDPKHVFQLDGSVVKQNEGREKNLKPCLLTHEVQLGNKTIPIVCIAFAVADLQLGVKRRGRRFER